jgi:hypothetical protein
VAVLGLLTRLQMLVERAAFAQLGVSSKYFPPVTCYTLNKYSNFWVLRPQRVCTQHVLQQSPSRPMLQRC